MFRFSTGNHVAKVNFGLMYAEGRGVPQDYAEAVRWYRLAADQGDAVAQSFLGLMYAEGQRVLQDYGQAHMLFNLAASRLTGAQRERAVSNRDAVADLMSPDDLSEAQRLAGEWDAAHPREALPPLIEPPCPPAVGSTSTSASSWSSEDSP